MSIDGKLAVLSERIFSQVKAVLILNMRFLDLAVFRLETVPAEVPLATDGALLLYQPAWILRRFQQESSQVARNAALKFM